MILPSVRRTPASLVSQVNGEIMAILRKPVGYIPPSIRVSKPAREFQLFEVLSAYVMSLIESDFEWTVTPLQHDGGVDFYGEKLLFRLPGLDDHVRMVIAGQCKASKNARSPLPNDLWRMLNAVNPTIVFIFLLADISKKRINDAQRLFSSETHRQCRILGLNDVIRLFHLYREEILQFLQHSLTGPDEATLSSFIRDLASESVAKFQIDTRVPDKALAGTPFYVHIDVHSLLLCKSPVRIRWEPSPDVMLIAPTGSVTPEGALLEPSQSFRSSLALKLVSYHVGDVPLGKLAIYVDGAQLQSLSLGSIATVDQYHPNFFWEPYQRHRARFVEILERVEAHSPEGLAITGQGGTGKSRFCLELGYFAEQRGARLVSISHPHHLEHPHVILGLLAHEILSSPFEPRSPRETLDSYVRSLHPLLHEKAKGTLDVIFATDAVSGGSFDREVMLQVLLLILLQKAETKTHVLHLSDMHWASTETLDILGDVLRRLRRMASEHGVSVLFLFEGRAQTHLTFQGRPPIEGSMHSTAVFESFVDRHGLERCHLGPFSASQSRAFLDHLFENAQSTDRRVPSELIPHQQVLIGEITRCGQGNPFHMVEQIRLLRHEGLVATNRRTGLIFLTAAPRASYDVPASVSELISLRLQFIAHTSPELALLIRAVGLIRDRIDARLFDSLHRTLAGHAPRSAIRELEILNCDDTSEVSFRHENYYHVVRGSPLNANDRRRVAGLYLRWYRGLRRKTPQVLYELASVHAERPRANFVLIRQLLMGALRKSEATHQYRLGIRIIGKLLDTVPSGAARRLRPSSRLLRDLTLRLRQATLSNEVEDWSLGAEQHERVIAEIDAYLHANRVSPVLGSQLSYLRTRSMVEVANSNTDLGRSHRSIALLTSARTVCESQFERGALRRASERDRWRQLYCRVLNRLGEAHWMDGNYLESLRSLENATRAIDDVRNLADRRLLQHINFLDHGAVLLHGSPSKGVATIKKGLSLVPRKGWSPQYEILGTTTLIVGEVVELFLRENGVSPRLRRFLGTRALPQLQLAFERALQYGFKQEQVAASLMTGISLSLLGDNTAVRWYMESVEIAFRSNNRESLWRGHLNLAQHLSSMSETEGCVFHCHRARQLLSADLQQRTAHERRWRQRHLARPLLRIASLLSGSDLAVDPFICTVIDEISAHSLADNVNDMSYFRDKIVHLRDGENEYYPYGG